MSLNPVGDCLSSMRGFMMTFLKGLQRQFSTFRNILQSGGNKPGNVDKTNVSGQKSCNSHFVCRIHDAWREPSLLGRLICDPKKRESGRVRMFESE